MQKLYIHARYIVPKSDEILFTFSHMMSFRHWNKYENFIFLSLELVEYRMICCWLPNPAVINEVKQRACEREKETNEHCCAPDNLFFSIFRSHHFDFTNFHVIFSLYSFMWKSCKPNDPSVRWHWSCYASARREGKGLGVDGSNWQRVACTKYSSGESRGRTGGRSEISKWKSCPALVWTAYEKYIVVGLNKWWRCKRKWRQWVFYQPFSVEFYSNPNLYEWERVQCAVTYSLNCWTNAKCFCGDKPLSLHIDSTDERKNNLLPSFRRRIVAVEKSARRWNIVTRAHHLSSSNDKDTVIQWHFVHNVQTSECIEASPSHVLIRLQLKPFFQWKPNFFFSFYFFYAIFSSRRRYSTRYEILQFWFAAKENLDVRSGK